MTRTDRHHRHPLTHKTPLVAIAVVAVLGIAACSDGASGGANSAGRKEVSLVFATGVPSGEDSRRVAEGVEQAAQDFGPIRYTFNTPPSFDPVAAQRQASDLLSTRPDGVGISPFPPELWQRTLSAASDQIDSLAFQTKPVETVDQATGSSVATFVGLNDTEIGRAAMRATIENSGLGPDTTGTALIGECFPSTSGALFERTQGIRQVLAAQLPQVRVAVFDSKTEPRENINAWEAVIQATPDAVVAIGTCDQDGVSIDNVKRRTGATIVAGALEAPPEVIRGLKDRTIAAAAANNYWLTGYVATRLLADRVRGVGSLPVGFIDTGFTMIDSNNAAEIEVRDSAPVEAARWYAPMVEEIFADLDSHVRPLADAWS